MRCLFKLDPGCVWVELYRDPVQVNVPPEPMAESDADIVLSEVRRKINRAWRSGCIWGSLAGVVASKVIDLLLRSP